MQKNIAQACVTQACEAGLKDKEAVRWVHTDLSDESLTYGFFETESNRIARVLQHSSIQTGDVVSIFLPRSPLLISSFFGILKLQAALLSTSVIANLNKKLILKSGIVRIFMDIVLIALFILMVSYLLSNGFTTFIYTQF